MSLFYVPWIVLAISTVIALRLPMGRDLSVPLFLVPWTSMQIDVGASVGLSQFVLIALALRYASVMRLNLGAIPAFGLIAFIIAIGVSASVITFATHSIDIVFVGGELRNGPFRTLVVLVVFLLAIIPFALLNAKGVRFSVIGLLRVYVISVLILCAFGIAQYLVFQATGNDIFPIGLFSRDPDRYKTGMIQVFGGLLMRPSSFAGEPKGLAMATTAAAVLMMTFGNRMFRSKAVFNGGFALCLAIIYLTQSTSAFVSFGLGIVVFFGLWYFGRPLARSTVLIGYFFGTVAIMGVYFYNVEIVPLGSNRSQLQEQIRQTESVFDLVYLRSLGRMNVEDMDWVIIKSYLEDPQGLILGRGFGLGHLFTGPYIPQRYFYMIGTLNSPKSGITLFLVNGGVVSLVLFVFFLVRITPAADDARRFQDAAFSDYIRRAQMAFIVLVIMLMLRTYVFEIGLLLMAVMSSALRPRVPGLQQPLAQKQRHVPINAPSRPASVRDAHSTNMSGREGGR